VADEYQFFITTSGGGGRSGGDEKFLSLSRQSRIMNLVCTQAKSMLLAVQRDENKIDAFIQCFRFPCLSCKTWTRRRISSRKRLLARSGTSAKISRGTT
jgi:hypothetical protein